MPLVIVGGGSGLKIVAMLLALLYGFGPQYVRSRPSGESGLGFPASKGSICLSKHE